MSNLMDLVPLLSQVSAVRRAQVVGFSDDGSVQVMPHGATQAIACQVLNPDSSMLSSGDDVLVWLGEAPIGAAAGVGGVVLGRVGPHAPAQHPVADAGTFATRPPSLVIETQGDLVLRNGQARIKLGAQGDVEIVCASFATRSQRLLRLLAPLIKLN